MNKLVEGFIHRQGVHCESTALRDIFEFYGFKFSEPMIFGLGSGLGFIYWHSKQMHCPFVGGRSRDFDENLCRNLNVTIKMNKTANRKRAYESLRDLVSENTPVMIHVDMPYLNYLGLPEQAHFGAHTVIVAGLDEEKGTAYIADTMFKDLQTAALDELERARSSIFKPFSPENKWFTFEFPAELISTEVAIRKALEETAQTMLHPPIKNLGVKGISYFAEEITKWPKLYSPENPMFRPLYEVTYIMIQEDGTGGGLFRYLYSRFLKEASELLNNKALADVGERYREIGQKWTKIAKLIRKTPETTDSVNEASRQLKEAARQETEALSKLLSIAEAIVGH